MCRILGLRRNCADSGSHFLLSLQALRESSILHLRADQALIEWAARISLDQIPGLLLVKPDTWYSANASAWTRSPHRTLLSATWTGTSSVCISYHIVQLRIQQVDHVNFQVDSASVDPAIHRELKHRVWIARPLKIIHPTRRIVRNPPRHLEADIGLACNLFQLGPIPTRLQAVVLDNEVIFYLRIADRDD
jgi:hypothetical protein